VQNKIGPIFLAALLSLYAALLATTTWAQDSKTGAEDINTWAKDVWTRDKLTGDWWGGRTWLSKHGIDIDLRLSQYWQRVATGGVDLNSEYGGTMDYRVNADLKKLLGSWDGLSVNMHARTRFGQDINADAGPFVLPNAGMLMPLPGDYHGTDITGLTASQMFTLFNRPADVTLGKLDIVDTLTGLFPWLSYGQDGFWNLNGIFPVLPWLGPIQGLSLFGGVAMSIHPEYGMPQTGFLAAGTKNVTTTWDVSGSFDQGVFMLGFHRFFWGDPHDKIGHFTITGYGSTKDQASNDPIDFIDIPGQGIVSTERKKPWGVSAFVYQEFWHAEGNPNRKANFVIAGSAGPDNPQFAHWSVFANVEAFGPMASRPHDRMGVSGWYSGLSNNFIDLVSPEVDLRDTWGFELYYNIAINKWLHLTPDIQFVQNEREADDFAIIPGVRLVMDF